MSKFKRMNIKHNGIFFNSQAAVDGNHLAGHRVVVAAGQVVIIFHIIFD